MTDSSILPLEYAALVRMSRRLDLSKTTQNVRIALLSDAATQQFVPLLRVLFHRQGVDAVIYEGAFDAIRLETLDPDSALYRFQPDVVVLLNSVQALRAALGNWAGDPLEFLREKSQSMLAIWDALQRHSAATVLQSNFVLPHERYFGNFDQKVPGAFSTLAQSLNAFLGEQARSRPGVLINDVEALASWMGRRNWFDDRLWDLAKTFCALDCLPAAAKNIVDIVMATRGRVMKCIILDLDNTLWGGVIGDDGLDGILLSPHGDGESFYRFQAYLKGLLKRGILLAVCSKNEMHNALLPFEKHPDMLLRREDISAFVADWNDKAQNILKIRDILNIGLDSMVFLDDNPFERNLVRGLVPEVIVPDLPEDPADYVRALSELNLFETISFSAEDLNRAELYRAEAARREQQTQFGSASEFLASLEMRIVVSRFDRFHLPRIAQLIQRSNQFNLTTHRYSESECAALMEDSRYVPVYVKLSDRLGDHGLIGIIVLEPTTEKLLIRDWLMSCRVLARGVEQYLMNLVVEQACSLGITQISGEYITTAKNGMVSEFFAQFGFTKTSENNGHTVWLLDVNSYQPVKTLIRPAETTAVV